MKTIYVKKVKSDSIYFSDVFEFKTDYVENHAEFLAEMKKVVDYPGGSSPEMFFDYDTKAWVMTKAKGDKLLAWLFSPITKKTITKNNDATLSTIYFSDNDNGAKYGFDKIEIQNTKGWEQEQAKEEKQDMDPSFESSIMYKDPFAPGSASDAFAKNFKDSFTTDKPGMKEEPDPPPEEKKAEEPTSYADIDDFDDFETLDITPEMEFCQAVMGNRTVPNTMKLEIAKKIYRIAAVYFHPDRCSLEDSSAIMASINLSYTKLKDGLGDK